MKHNKDKLVEEGLGHMLSEGVRLDKPQHDRCLSAEDIAAMLEGGAGGRERDRMMAHIASCDTCLDTFQLSAGLMEEDNSHRSTYREFEVSTGLLEEKPHKRSLRSIYKPLALAASVAIVAVGMYLFFNSTFIPNTADKHKSFRDESPTATETIVLPESEPKSAAQSASQATAPIYKKTDSPSPSKALSNERSKGKITRKKEGKAQFKSVYDKKGGKRVTKRKDIPDDGLRLPPAPSKKQKAAPPREKQRMKMEEAEKPADREQRLQARQEKADTFQKDEADQNLPRQSATVTPITMEPTSTTGLQRLNMITQQQAGYLRAADLRNMFSQALQLKSDLTRDFKRNQIQTQTVQSKKRQASKRLSYAQPDVLAQYRPLVQVVQQASGDVVLPDVSYLLSRSQPGTIEYDFFNLARAGWCTPDGVCIQGRNLIASFGKSIDKKTLLTRWETIYPSLTGTFKQIAEATMERMKSGS